MAKVTGTKPKREDEEEAPVKRRHSAGTDVASREAKITRLVYDLVEERVRRKTATSQETTHFLKIGSSLAQLERQKLENENLLLKAKAEAIVSQKVQEELYRAAITAFAKYSGQDQDEHD